MTSLTSLIVWLLICLGFADSPADALDIISASGDTYAECDGPAGEAVPGPHGQACAADVPPATKGPAGAPGGPMNNSADDHGIFNGI